MRVCLGEVKREQNLYRHTRLLLGGILHTDPRKLVPMKGDFDHLRAMPKVEINELLRKWGKTEWVN